MSAAECAHRSPSCNGSTEVLRTRVTDVAQLARGRGVSVTYSLRVQYQYQYRIDNGSRPIRLGASRVSPDLDARSRRRARVRPRRRS